MPPPCVWGVTASMFPPWVGRQINLCICAASTRGVSWHLCFLRVWVGKATYAFMPPPCVGYHSIYVSPMCGETNQPMHLCRLHVCGIMASMFPPCVGRPINICIYATSMGGYHGIYVSSMCGDTYQHIHLCRLHARGITAFIVRPC